jgi:hypothetical protein
MSELVDTIRSMDSASKQLCTEYMHRKFSKLELQIISNAMIQMEQATQILRSKLASSQKSESK